LELQGGDGGEEAVMFDRKKLKRAVDLQHRSYLIMQWMVDAVKKGFIDFRSAHKYSTLPEAASAWITDHFLNFPAKIRPQAEEIGLVAAFLTTYLENSFVLIEHPGKQVYSSHAHCFCPMCSWLVDAPNLQTKKITSIEKRRAEKLRAHALAQLALDCKIDISSQQIERLLNDESVRESASLVAYGHDLFKRVEGIAEGPAILALWRSFAWKKEGSPKPDFKLTVDCILDAEKNLIDVLKNIEAQS
jgi:hypothetical protein